MKRGISILMAGLAILLLFSCGGVKYENATATSYYVAHSGGYIGETVVTVDGEQNVVSAEWHEWQGPGGWAEFNSEDGKSLVDGAVVRVPDPTANLGSSDPEVKGYQFYIFVVGDGVSSWLPYSAGDDGFSRPSRHLERDFEGKMANPMLAKAYVEAAKAGKLVNVTIEGTKVIVGKNANETVHYGHMDKTNPASTYMGIRENSIGYRYNNKATVDFFKANPTADFASATTAKAKVTLTPDNSVDSSGAESTYNVESDSIWGVADTYSGATFSDFRHYSMELQKTYYMALGQQLLQAK